MLDPKQDHKDSRRGDQIEPRTSIRMRAECIQADEHAAGQRDGEDVRMAGPLEERYRLDELGCDEPAEGEPEPPESPGPHAPLSAVTCFQEVSALEDRCYAERHGCIENDDREHELA